MMNSLAHYLNNTITVLTIISMSFASFIAGGYERYQEIEIKKQTYIINYLLTVNIKELSLLDYHSLGG